jgi:DNA polymerase-4
MLMNQRVIMHIDMNSYFASCEQQDNLAWRDKPLGVCEHLGGIIIAPSVEAKRWGIKTGTPVWEARKLCPQIILTKTNPDRYRYYTAKFLKVFEDYTKDIERYSIDEAFLDVTRVCNIRVVRSETTNVSESTNRLRIITAHTDPFAEAEKVAKEIKVRMKTEVGDYLRCSVGIGWSKLIAKIASDMQKPDGLVVMRPEDKGMLYEKLSLTDIPGIGKRQARRLNDKGIRTLLDLKNCPVGHLRKWFGVMGYHLWSMGQLEGLWHESFSEEAPLKSVGHMYTIAQEFRQRPGVGEKVLYRLSEMVARRLRSLGVGATALAAHVADKDYNFFGGQRQLGSPTSTGQDIFTGARHAILGGLSGSWPETVYRVGVTAFGLAPYRAQLSLFPQVTKRLKVDKALDSINGKYSKGEWEEARERAALGRTPSNRGGDVILPAPAFFAQDIIRDSTGFGRMREFTVSEYKRGD